MTNNPLSICYSRLELHECQQVWEVCKHSSGGVGVVCFTITHKGATGGSIIRIHRITSCDILNYTLINLLPARSSIFLESTIQIWVIETRECTVHLRCQNRSVTLWHGLNMTQEAIIHKLVICTTVISYLSLAVVDDHYSIRCVGF